MVGSDVSGSGVAHTCGTLALGQLYLSAWWDSYSLQLDIISRDNAWSDEQTYTALVSQLCGAAFDVLGTRYLAGRVGNQLSALHQALEARFSDSCLSEIVASWSAMLSPTRGNQNNDSPSCRCPAPRPQGISWSVKRRH